MCEIVGILSVWLSERELEWSICLIHSKSSSIQWINTHQISGRLPGYFPQLTYRNPAHWDGQREHYTPAYIYITERRTSSLTVHYFGAASEAEGQTQEKMCGKWNMRGSNKRGKVRANLSSNDESRRGRQWKEWHLQLLGEVLDFLYTDTENVCTCPTLCWTRSQERFAFLSLHHSLCFTFSLAGFINRPLGFLSEPQRE